MMEVSSGDDSASSSFSRSIGGLHLSRREAAEGMEMMEMMAINEKKKTLRGERGKESHFKVEVVVKFQFLKF